MTMPCTPWIDEDEMCVPCSGVYDDTLADHIQAASELLYLLSGRQFQGECEETIHPCSNRQFRNWTGQPWYPSLAPQLGYWAICGCRENDPCSCSSVPVIELPRWPIISIEDVTIDGYPLDSSAYEMRGHYLARIDGDAWPCCDDSFTIAYKWGTEVPQSGKTAVATLACELFLACNPNAIEGAQCRLPRNIASISRQGVSVIFERLTRTGGPFRFGIWEIDIFLEAWNPHGVDGPSVIMSPDTMLDARVIPFP